MKRINFKEMEVAYDIERKHTRKEDLRTTFANLLYARGTGIQAHSLAYRIYESDKPIEVSDEEYEIVVGILDNQCTPMYIEAIKKAFEDAKGEAVAEATPVEG